MPSAEELIALVGAWYSAHGYTLVFAGALAENTALLGLFLPGGTLTALGAFYARVGTLNLAVVILLAWLGTVLGYHVDYLVGRYALTRLLGHYGSTALGRRLRLAGRVRLARAFLARHGGKAILLSHVAGHLRSFVALGAGATRMRYSRFLAFELVAALIWSTAFCAAGYLIGAELNTLLGVIERVGWAGLALIVATVAAWSIARRRARASRRQRRLARRPAARGPVGTVEEGDR